MMRAILISISTGLIFITSCTEFLSVKPDAKLAIPQTGKDLRALLDNVVQMNYGMPTGIGEIGSDNLFLPDSYWSSLNANYRMEYAWQKMPVTRVYWNTPYRAILYANTVIDNINSVRFDNPQERDDVLGAAYFYRGYLCYELAQIFASPYHKQTATEKLGIALQLESDVNADLFRSSLQQTYDQIITDLKAAANLLPEGRPQFPTRPYKGAAYGALARSYLAMAEYQEAGVYADSCLRLAGELLDYKTISDEDYPFERFNKEVIYHSHMIGYGGLAPERLRVDTLLYNSFLESDLRKSLYFSQADDGYFTFTGDYGQNNSLERFNGITTAEMLLVRAECSARNTKIQEAKNDLTRLMVHRYEGLLPSLDGYDSSEALLEKILLERRKELVFRGQRWSDIRRLSWEPGRAVELVRELNGEVLMLSPDLQKEFAYLIPEEVIQMGNLPQN